MRPIIRLIGDPEGSARRTKVWESLVKEGDRVLGHYAIAQNRLCVVRIRRAPAVWRFASLETLLLRRVPGGRPTTWASGGVRFVENLGLEIKARRKTEVAVTRSRVAVDTAMLASLVRVYRTIKWNVRRIVATDNVAGRHRPEHGFRNSTSSGMSLLLIEMGLPCVEPTFRRRDCATAFVRVHSHAGLQYCI